MLKDKFPALSKLFSLLGISIETVIKFGFAWEIYEDSISDLDDEAMKDFAEKLKGKIPTDQDQRKWLNFFDFMDEAYVYSKTFRERRIRPKFIPERDRKGELTPDIKLEDGKKKTLIEVKNIQYSDDQLKEFEIIFEREKRGEKQPLKWINKEIKPTFYKKIVDWVNKAVSQIKSYGEPDCTGEIHLFISPDDNVIANGVSLGKKSPVNIFLRKVNQKLSKRNINLKVYLKNGVGRIIEFYLPLMK